MCCISFINGKQQRDRKRPQERLRNTVKKVYSVRFGIRRPLGCQGGRFETTLWDLEKVIFPKFKSNALSCCFLKFTCGCYFHYGQVSQKVPKQCLSS